MRVTRRLFNQITTAASVGTLLDPAGAVTTAAKAAPKLANISGIAQPIAGINSFVSQTDSEIFLALLTGDAEKSLSTINLLQVINNSNAGFSKGFYQQPEGQVLGREIEASEFQTIKNLFPHISELISNPGKLALRFIEQAEEDGIDPDTITGQSWGAADFPYQLKKYEELMDLKDRIQRGVAGQKEILNFMNIKGPLEDTILSFAREGITNPNLRELVTRYRGSRITGITTQAKKNYRMREQIERLKKQQETEREEDKAKRNRKIETRKPRFISDDSRNVFLARQHLAPAYASHLDKRFGWQGYLEKPLEKDQKSDDGIPF